MKKLVLALLLILSLLYVSNAQSSRFFLSEEWVSESGSQNHFIESYSTVDAAGNSYVAGATINSSGNYDILVSKFDNSGNLQWNYQVDGPGSSNDIGTFVLLDDSLNVYVTGGISNLLNDSSDIFLAKLDENGNEKWRYIKSGVSKKKDIGTSLFFDDSSHVYLVGSIIADTIKKSDLYLGRFSVSGNLKWDIFRDFGTSHDAGVQGSFDVTNRHCVIYSLANIPFVTYNWEIKQSTFVSHNGSFVSTSTFNSWPQGSLVTIEDIVRDVSNNIYLTGMSTDSLGSKDVFVNKIDASFNEEWRLIVDGGDSVEDYGKSIFVDDSGYVYVAANIRTVSQGLDYLTIKIAADSVVWIGRTGCLGYGDDLVKSVVVNDSGYVITSGSSLNDSLDYDFFSICYDRFGYMVWTATYDNGVSGHDKVFNTALNNNDLYVTGQCQTSSGITYKTVKYEHLFLETEIIGETDSTSGYVSGELILFFSNDALASSKDDYNNGNKTFGTLSDYLNPTAISAIKNKVDTTDINVGDWKAYRVLPHWASSDTLSITRFGDTVPIPPFYSALVLIVPSNYTDTIVRDSLQSLYTYISSVGLNSTLSLSASANDPLFSEQLYLNSGDEKINVEVEDAWDYSVGSPNIKVGVFDCGINWAHEDLVSDPNNSNVFNQSRIKGGRCYNCPNKAEIRSVTPDKNDEGGPIGLKWNRGHGTPVAGIIGAIRNNNLGIAGIAGGNGSNVTTGVSLYDMKILKVPREPVNAFASNAIPAILDAATDVPANSSTGKKTGYGLDIINNSWLMSKSSDNFSYGQQIIMALGYCYKQGCIINFASGNDNGNASSLTELPGRIPDEWSLLTGGSKSNGLRADIGPLGTGANYSSRLDVIAPYKRELLYSTLRSRITEDVNLPKYGRQGFFGSNDQDDLLEGTSFSAPMVTATASLMLSFLKTNNFLKLAQEDVEAIIEMSAKKFQSPADYNVNEGHGLLKISKSLQNIDLRKNIRIFHINSNGQGVTTSKSISNLYSNLQVNLVKLGDQYAIINLSDKNGLYKADVKKVTCTMNFTIPEPLFNKKQWERHSFADGLKLNSNISEYQGGAAANLFYHSETYNTFSTPNSPISWSGTTGQCTMESYFYEITHQVTSSGDVAINHFWVPFDPYNVSPKFGFTVYGSAWQTSVEELGKIGMKSVLYPNPTRSEAWIEVSEGLHDKQIAISLYSIDGRLVSKNIHQNNADHKFKIDTNNLSVGLYIAVIDGDSFTDSHKLIIKE